MFSVVRYRRLRWRFEPLADQHERERTQTISGKKLRGPQVCFKFCLSRLCLVSSRPLPVILVFCLLFSCVSVTVTITNRLLCFSVPDFAVPQQDSSRLCLCGLLVPHRHCGAFNRQQVRETLQSPQMSSVSELLIKIWSRDNDTFFDQSVRKVIWWFLTPQERVSVGHSGDSCEQPCTQ